MTPLKLPDQPTIEQIKAIALATIRTTFENDATDVGDIEPFGMDGWKTTYWVDNQQFEVTYNKRNGFGKRPIGANFSEEDAPSYRLGDSDRICLDCIHSRASKPGEDAWISCDKYDFEVDPSGVCDSWEGDTSFSELPQPIQQSGELLDEAEWDAIASISDEDIQDAIDMMPGESELTEFWETLEAIGNGSFYFYDFAAKQKAAGKKKCTPGKSHFCQKEGGAGTCLPVSKKCRFVPQEEAKEVGDYVKEKVAGSSTSVSTIPSREIAKKSFKKLGEGVEAEVFLAETPNGKQAVKYFFETDANGNKQDTPFTTQNSDGELYIDQIQRGMNTAADLGIAPRLLSISVEHKALSMELLDGYKAGLMHDRKSSKGADMSDYDKSFLAALKKAHMSQYTVYDLHEDNVMVNPKTKDVKFIDQGDFKQTSYATIAQQLLGNGSIDGRPFASNVLDRFASTFSDQDKQVLAQIRKFIPTHKKIVLSKGKPLTEEHYKKLVEKAYSIITPYL